MCFNFELKVQATDQTSYVSAQTNVLIKVVYGVENQIVCENDFVVIKLFPEGCIFRALFNILFCF